jgi:hypothetical protein
MRVTINAAMRHKWNWALWTGFAAALLATFSYLPVFVPFPITRDFPWANLLLFLAGGCGLGVGLSRAFRKPEQYRGRIAGSVAAFLSFALFALFCYGIFVDARRIPSADAALRAGRQAPEFTLAGTDGKLVTLSELRRDNRAVLLIFYRGYW